MPTLEAVVAHPVHVVLEVDDELERSILKSRHFEEIGAWHEAASGLEDARSALHAMGPKQQAGTKNLVIVLDLMFRETYEAEEGMRFIKEVREGKLGVHPSTPIVVLSNARSPQIMGQAFAMGANHFFSKSDDPRLIVARLKFYLGGDSVESRHSCEVVDLDFSQGRVRIRLRAGEKWILERWMPIDFCPLDSRVVGGSFFWENVAFFQDYSTQYKVRSSVLGDRDAVERLLDPEW
jgi:DNA-binding NarL/FixJ family response regulator